MSVRSSEGQDAIFSQFFSTPVYLNPAFAGSESGFRTVLNYRHHPLAETGDFSTVNASIDSYVPALYGGLGLLLTSDYQGGFSWKNHIDLAYAYHLKLSRQWHVNFAAQAGYYRRDNRWGNMEFTDPGQTMPQQDFRHSPNFAAGLVIYNDWLYGGLASHHLTEPKESYSGGHVLPMKHTIHMGAYVEPVERRRANTLLLDYFISPNVIYQYQEPFERVNYGLYFGVESFIAGVWYRQNFEKENPNTLIFLVGLNLDNYKLGYSYDYSLSGFTDAFHAIHEISLSFNFLTDKQNKREQPIRCPYF